MPRVGDRGDLTPDPPLARRQPRASGEIPDSASQPLSRGSWMMLFPAAGRILRPFRCASCTAGVNRWPFISADAVPAGFTATAPPNITLRKSLTNRCHREKEASSSDIARSHDSCKPEGDSCPTSKTSAVGFSFLNSLQSAKPSCGSPRVNAHTTGGSLCITSSLARDLTFRRTGTAAEVIVAVTIGSSSTDLKSQGTSVGIA